MSWPDASVGEIAGRQHGLVTRGQLLEQGLTEALIDHSLRRGRLCRVHRGVYAVGHLALPELARYMAAVLALGPRALLSHDSASALWGLSSARAGEVEVTLVGSDAGRGRAGIRVHRVAGLARADTATHHGIPVSSAARALLEVAPRLDDRRLAQAFDAGLKARILTRDAVLATVGRSPSRPGSSRLGALATAELGTSLDTRSPPEERLVALVRAGGLPEPETNVWIGGHLVDALWRAHRLVVELDSYGFHSTRRSFESDHERDLALAALGLTVIRFTVQQLERRPQQVLVRLAQRLALAEAQLRPSGA